MKSVLALSMLAVAAIAAEWSVIYPNVMTIAMGVDTTPNGTVYVSGADDGTGPAVLRSLDKGVTWETTRQNSLEMMYMDVAMGSDDFGVVGGIGMFNFVVGSAVTTDGFNWASTPGEYFVAIAQSVGASGNGTLYLVGAWQESLIEEYQEGVRKSVDAGQTMTNFPIDSESWVRYGSFPSENTWYISCGYWPASEKDAKVRPFSQFVTLNASKGSVQHTINTETSKSNDGYGAEIYKTTDGGATFTRVFSEFDRFYFNGLDCPTDDHCVAVAEGNDGGFIFTTVDGGKTWTETGFFAGAGLFNVDMIDTKEGWAVGAFFEGITFNAAFLHTTDGGFTWTVGNTVENAYPNAITCVSSTEAYATAFLRNGLSAIIGLN